MAVFGLGSTYAQKVNNPFSFMVKNNPWKVDSFYFKIKRLEILENGTAIICGTGYVNNNQIASTYQSSNFLIKRNGQWKAYASHVSGYKEVLK